MPSFQKNWNNELTKSGFDNQYAILYSIKLCHLLTSSVSFTVSKDSDSEIELKSETSTSDMKTKKKTKKKTKEPSLVRAVVYAFGGTILVAGIFKFFRDVVTFVSPLLLR